MAQCDADAEIAEPPQPRAEQRRGLHRLREDAAARADECLLTQRLGEGAQRIRREMFDGALQERVDGAVAREEFLEWLRMREVEAAAAGEQELAPERWHPVMNRHGDAGARQQLGGD